MEDTDFQPHVLEQARQRVGSWLRQKWHLDRLLGMGGMAAVYEATHRTGSRVAIKMLHATHAWNQDVTRRFLREGYVANTVGHPGAVKILDDDVAEDGAVFIVMELLEGETFEARCERAGGRLPPAEVLAMMDQLLGTLAAAHAKRIVHRDIKPENIFVTHEGAVKLLDFGIAKVRSSHPDSVATIVGSMVGTPRFMAPEQALGRTDSIDARSDLWGVGAVMFWAMTGRPVHLAQTLPEQLVAQATKHTPSLTGIAPEIPAPVGAIVDRALAFEQDMRWPDALTMQQAIREAQAALGLPRVAPMLSLPPQGELPLRVPSGLDLDRVAAGSASSGLSRTEISDVLVQPPRASHRTPMALGIVAVALAIGVYLVVRGGHDAGAPPAGPSPPNAPAQAEPSPAARPTPPTRPTGEPEVPRPATATPVTMPSGGEVQVMPTAASAPTPADPPRRAPPSQPRASATHAPTATPTTNEDWLNRQH